MDIRSTITLTPGQLWAQVVRKWLGLVMNLPTFGRKWYH